MSKSIDLREAAVAYHEAGHTIEETAEVFQVGKSTISEWKKKKKETGNLNNVSSTEKISQTGIKSPPAY